MEWLPDDYEGSWTLEREVSRKGLCLHSGLESEVKLSFSELAGFHVSFKNSLNSPVTLHPSQVINSDLCTTLDLGNQKLSTVEHLLAALVGCGITHVNIEVSGEEIPLLDGSAIEWVKAIEEAGIKQANTLRKEAPVIDNSLIINEGLSLITAIPFERTKLVSIIDFPYPAIGRQIFSLELTPRTFVEQIAPARTFGFKDQVDYLISKGLIKGGNLNNSLVCNGDHWLNPPLRFENEPVRHKLLDLIGDLALTGLPKAQVLVYRGSHALHSQLALSLSS